MKVDIRLKAQSFSGNKRIHQLQIWSRKSSWNDLIAISNASSALNYPAKRSAASTAAKLCVGSTSAI